MIASQPSQTIRLQINTLLISACRRPHGTRAIHAPCLLLGFGRQFLPAEPGSAQARRVGADISHLHPEFACWKATMPQPPGPLRMPKKKLKAHPMWRWPFCSPTTKQTKSGAGAGCSSQVKPNSATPHRFLHLLLDELLTSTQPTYGS